MPDPSQTPAAASVGAARSHDAIAASGSALSAGAWVGIVLGHCGWVIGVAIVSAVAGDWQLVGTTVVPGLVLSIALGLAMGLTLTLAHRSGCSLARRQQMLFGLLANHIGLLLFVTNHWLAPLLESSPEADAVMRMTGSVTRVADWLPIALLAAGSGCLLHALRAQRREGEARS